jgi:hypothetical protein
MGAPAGLPGGSTSIIRAEEGSEPFYVRRVVGPVDHAVAIRAEHSEICGDIMTDRSALFEKCYGTQVVRFYRAFAKRSVFLSKREVADLAAQTVMLLGGLGRCRISLYANV